jgi:hypothetical protein
MAEPPAPLRRSSSDYLLLTSTHANEADLIIPRPRAFAALPAMAALDLASSIVFTVLVPVHKVQGCAYLLALAYIRGLAVLQTGWSSRIRQRGWLVALGSLATLFAILYDSNALVQRFGSLDPSLQRRPSPVFVALLLTQLALALLHWLVFVVVVGVSKKRNPFGLGFNSSSSSYRFERSCDVEEEDVAGSSDILSVDQGSILEVDEESSEDENDIVDIPPTTPASYTSPDGLATLRPRASRQSLGRDRRVSRTF